VARPRSEDKRRAILLAASEVVAQDGLAARTAVIAERAGVSNGTLFKYFETKHGLFNELYIELKEEISAAVKGGLSEDVSFHDQALYVWNSWMRWGTTWPHKERALSILEGSNMLTTHSRRAGHTAMAPIVQLVERARREGPMQNQLADFVVGIVAAIAGVTMDFMIRDSALADQRARIGFDALWRALLTQESGPPTQVKERRTTA
jgi:AcrR family transcriptional regulator